MGSTLQPTQSFLETAGKSLTLYMIESSRLHSKMLETCRVEIDELPASIPWIVFDKARTVVKLFHTRSVASQFHGRKALNSLGWLSCCFTYTSLHTDVDPRTLFETTLDLVRQTQPWRVEVFPVLRHVRIREHERVTGYSMNLDAIIFHQLGVCRCSVHVVWTRGYQVLL